MKQIKVSEDLFEYLKKEAEANFRPIGKQIEFYLFGDPRVSLKDIVKPQPTPKASKAIDRAVKKSVEAQAGTSGVVVEAKLHEDSVDEFVPTKPKFKLTGKLCKEHKVDVDICKNMKH